MARVGGQTPRRSWDLSRWVILLAAEKAAILAAAGLAAGPVIASLGSAELPGLLLAIAATAAIGAVAGGVLGALQSLVLRGQVRHPGYSTSLHAYRRRYRRAPAGAAALIVWIIPVHPSPVAQPLTPSGRTA